MAGTRLLINLSFLIQLLGLFAASLFFGLCQLDDDFVCRSLTSQQGRWWLGSALATKQLEDTVARLNKLTKSSPIEFAVSESEATYWQHSLLKTVKLDEDEIVVRPAISDETLSSVCRNPKVSEYTNQADVWICEYTKEDGQSAEGTARAVTINSTLVLYPQGLSERLDDVRQIYPRFPRRRSILRIQVITDRSDWKEWFQHLNFGIRSAKLDSWPCLKGPSQVDVLFRNLTDNSFLSSSHDADEQAFYLIKAEDVLSPSQPAEIAVNILLPQSSPMRLVQGGNPTASERSSLGQQGDSFAVVVDTATADPSEATELALKRTLGRVRRQCMEIPSPVDSFTVDTDGSLPTLYSKLWYQRAMREAIASFVTAARDEQRLILNLPRSVAVTDEIASVWRNALEATETVQRLWSDLRFAEAMQQMDESLALLKSLQQNPDLLEPMDFPLDQYAAIFAPLLLPLMLPIIVGVGREIKRCKELRKKKTQALAPNT